MGQGNNKHTTHVANCYHQDIQACVKANRIEIYEEEKAIKGKVGVSSLPVEVGAAYKNHQKRNYVMQDPGFATIKPDSYFGFAESGPDGKVFVTIQIGSDIPHANVQVHNGCNVLLDKNGSLRNANDNQIWTDTLGKSHLSEPPSNMEIISLAKPHPSEDGNALQRYISKGKVKKYFGTEGKGAGQLYRPAGISSTASDDIVVSDYYNRIQIFDVNGKVKGVIGGKGDADGQFNGGCDVCVTSRGWIVASDTSNHRIQMFDEQGKFVRKFGGDGSGDEEMGFFCGVATDDKGLIYACVGSGVRIFSVEGKYIGKLCGMHRPSRVSVTSNGRIVVSDIHTVHVFDLYAGRELFHFGTKGTTESDFNWVSGIATDDHGNIIVCDQDNNRVQIFTSNGAFVSCFGSKGSKPGQMKMPMGVCVLSDGGIAISDYGNSRVQIF